MQKSIWLLAFLPYLHWFGSLVSGATVLTSTSNVTRIVQPNRLNGSTESDISVIDKVRGPKLPAAQLFKTAIELMSTVLAPEDAWGLIKGESWSLKGLILGLVMNGYLGNVVERAAFMQSLYFVFLLMKQEQDFRSGVFAIHYLGVPWFDILILPVGSSGLELAPSLAHVTQLNPLPSPITTSTNGASQILANDLDFSVNLTQIEPFLIRPMDELGQWISIMDMVLTVAEPAANETVQENIESIVPFSGVKISLTLAPKFPSHVLQYSFVNWALGFMSSRLAGSRGQALRAQMYLDHHYLGEITMVPSDSSPSTSPLVEAFLNRSTDGTATARKK